jgi:hypothetical protein
MNIAGGSDRLRREKAFHHNDDAITVDDLWESWFESDERGWTVEQTTKWLTTAVQLPQYAAVFVKHNIDGQMLPRCLLSMSFLL